VGLSVEGARGRENVHKGAGQGVRAATTSSRLDVSRQKTQRSFGATLFPKQRWAAAGNFFEVRKERPSFWRRFAELANGRRQGAACDGGCGLEGGVSNPVLPRGDERAGFCRDLRNSPLRLLDSWRRCGVSFCEQFAEGLN
jgi:hypothetical protein